MVLRVHLVTAVELTVLAMGTWSWSNVSSCLDHFEPIVVGSPFGGLRIAEF
jgi:hypothetical protein